MDNKYQTQSKIYKLQCSNGYFYIGSTINDLRKRLSQHKGQALRFPNRCLYKHILEIGWDAVKIILVKSVNVQNRQELTKQEDMEIQSFKDDLFCLNINRAKRTKDEYWNDVKEQVNETRRRNYQMPQVKEMLRQRKQEARRQHPEWRKKKILCECGTETLADDILRHKRTTKHKTLMAGGVYSPNRLICECGLGYTKTHRARHIQTQKHRELVENNQWD